jgi:hypothetical protein
VEARWLGPCVVTERVGENSYLVEIHPGRIIPAHRVQLLPWREDEAIFPPTPLFTFRPETASLEVDEWEVETIINHRVLPDGSLQFLTHWKGFPIGESTWEPVRSFIHRYSEDFIDYVKRRGLPIDILHSL